MSNVRQLRFYNWAVRTFGKPASNCRERALRFVEEAIEVAHAAGLDAADVYRVLNRVYLRPRGAIHQELGQAALTLEALAEANGISLESEADSEFKRVESLPKEYWLARQNAKAAQGLGEYV